MDLKNAYGTVLFSAAVQTIKELVVAAVKKGAYLRGADLQGADLQGADLRGADLQGADLRGADLQGADLQGAYLQGADLQGAYLRGADLQGAYLQGAYLQGADLQGADLRGADLQGAYLQGADLQGAYLQGAYLRGAYLQGADLQGAYLRGAYLRGADLQGAYLRGADLQGADLQGAKNIPTLALAQLQHIPETGAFVGFKKCQNNVIVKLLIPKDAKRSHGSERKCRASKAFVLNVFGGEFGVSLHDNKTEYRKGAMVTPDGWGEDRWETCAPGIHFYITRAEAEAHQ